MKRALAALAVVVLPAHAHAQTGGSCPAVYNGFFSTSITADVIKNVWRLSTTIGQGVYTSTISPAVQLGAGVLLCWYLASFTQTALPMTPDSVKTAQADLRLITGIKAAGICALLTAGGIGGFDAVYLGFVNLIVGYGLEPAMLILQQTVTAATPSLGRILGPSCNGATDTGAIIACLAHATEASLGWALQAVLEPIKTLRLWDGTLLFALFLLWTLVRPILQGPAALLKNTFYASAALFTVPYVLILWVIPWTNGAPKALAKVAVRTAFAIVFVSCIVAALAAVATSVLTNSRAIFFTFPVNFTGDPFDCMVHAAQNGSLSIVPWSPSFWLLLFMGRLYSDLLEEVNSLANEFAGAIVKGNG